MLPGADAAANRFIVPMTLISCSGRRRHLGRVDDEERVDDRVDLRRLHDAGEDRVVLVAAHVLGALELDRAAPSVSRPTITSTSRIVLERLRDPAAPERAEPGDEDRDGPRQPNQTERRCRSMS